MLQSSFVGRILEKEALNFKGKSADNLEINHIMDEHDLATFAGLPTELLLTVIKHCAIRDIAALSGVTKKLNSICRPIVFRDIDLSIHNRGQVRCTFPCPDTDLCAKWDEPSDSLKCNNIPPKMQKRQESFLSALLRNPSLALNVNSFSWTLLLVNSNPRPDLGNYPFEINYSVSINPKSPFNEIWTVFASLTNVRNLDLAWLSRDLATPLIHRIPPTLFPAATNVRLVGIMPYALAASILLTNPQNLLHLDLDNLQQSGIIPNVPTYEDPALDDYDFQIDEAPCEQEGKITKVEQVLTLVLSEYFHYLGDFNTISAIATVLNGSDGDPAVDDYDSQIDEAPSQTESKNTKVLRVLSLVCDVLFYSPDDISTINAIADVINGIDGDPAVDDYDSRQDEASSQTVGKNTKVQQVLTLVFDEYFHYLDDDDTINAMATILSDFAIPKLAIHESLAIDDYDSRKDEAPSQIEDKNTQVQQVLALVFMNTFTTLMTSTP